jgi:kynurenine formamidase
MKLVDLTHPFSIHTPGWVGYPSPKLSYLQRHATNGIVSQYLETPLHAGTHFDAQMHIVSGGSDMASVPLSKLCHEGVVVDLSDEMDDFSVITPKQVTDRIEVSKGDVVVFHTGWHRYFNGGRDEDEERYFLRHPGGGRELAEWIVEMDLAWTAVDCGSGDHPMNTSIRVKRPDVTREYERKMGQTVEEIWPEADLFVMHRVPFRRGITHVENAGGDIERVLNRRCLIGAFPIPIQGGEASPCRLVAFVDD